QAVLKVRKRVTLMVLIVTVIFGICWWNLLPPTNSARKYVNFLVHLTFNAAVNPFAYVLVNQRFRQKMKGIL
ncbi:unnamed protein product, partial [Porites evermanni]